MRTCKRCGNENVKGHRCIATVLSGYQLDMENHGHLITRPLPKPVPGKDTGCDPLGNGMFKMYPSGDVVDYAERCKRLGN